MSIHAGLSAIEQGQVDVRIAPPPSVTLDVHDTCDVTHSRVAPKPKAYVLNTSDCWACLAAQTPTLTLTRHLAGRLRPSHSWWPLNFGG